jgi:hypothetical protein
LARKVQKMIYVVNVLELGGRKEVEIDADYMNQGTLAVEFYKKDENNKSQLVAAFEKGKFISAIAKK